MRRLEKRFICLLLVLAICFSTGITEAATIRIRWRISVTTRLRIRRGGKSSNQVRLSDKTDKIEVGEESYIALWNASNAVKWSVSKKGIIKIKKDGNGVAYIGLKPGKCYLKAKYKGKTYKCKVTVKIGNNLTLWPYEYAFYSASYAESASVKANYKYPCTIQCYVEDPSIAYTDVFYDPDPIDKEYGDYGVAIYVYGLKHGNTRVIVKNSYNPNEVDYINVSVSEKRVNLAPAGFEKYEADTVWPIWVDLSW